MSHSLGFTQLAILVLHGLQNKYPYFRYILLRILGLLSITSHLFFSPLSTTFNLFAGKSSPQSSHTVYFLLSVSPIFSLPSILYFRLCVSLLKSAAASSSRSPQSVLSSLRCSPRFCLIIALLARSLFCRPSLLVSLACSCRTVVCCIYYNFSNLPTPI